MAEKFQRMAYISLIFIGIVLLVFILKEFQSFLRPFVIALILSFLFVPITRFSKEKKILVGLNTLIIIIVLFIVGGIIGTLIAGESENLENSENPGWYAEFMDSAIIQVGENSYDFSNFLDPKEITTFVNSIMGSLFSTASGFFGGLFLTLIFLMFLLSSHDEFFNRVSKKLDDNESKKFTESLKQIEQSIRTYLSVKSLVSLGTALSSLIIMVLFGVQYMILFTLMLFILNFIPNIGSFIGVGVIIFSYFLANGFNASFVFLAIFLTLIQIAFGNIIEPKIAGRELDLSPIVILLSLFFWGYIWGIVGMLFAVPLTSIIKIVLQNFKSTKKFVAFLS